MSVWSSDYECMRSFFFFFILKRSIASLRKIILAQQVQWFVLVFYVGFILDDKNTLCNGYKLTGWSVLIWESSSIQTVFISKHVTDHNLLEDVHKDSLQIPSQINRFPCNRPDEPLTASERSAVSSRLRWRRPDASSIIVPYIIGFQKSTLLGKSLQVVRTLSSISEYSSVPFERRKEL
jgi:hypothetical protein